jgi:hypothetical protein
MKKLNLYIFIIVIALFSGIIYYINTYDFDGYFLAALVPASRFEEGDIYLENFARCLTEKEIILYGTAWDGHTQKQKELFGKAAKYLTYIECMAEEGGTVLSECELAEIKGFPAWEIFENIIVGRISIKRLSDLSGCPLY